MNQRTRVSFRSDQLLDLAASYKYVQSNKCGAINIFSGTIREHDLKVSGEGSNSKVDTPIKGIYYEAYQPMATKQIMRIVDECHLAGLGDEHDDGNTRVCIGIRVGFVPVGESSIIICASSTRRVHSHQLIMSILQRIKAEVVIWKKIAFTDGTEQWDLESKSEASWLQQQQEQQPSYLGVR